MSILKTCLLRTPRIVTEVIPGVCWSVVLRLAVEADRFVRPIRKRCNALSEALEGLLLGRMKSKACSRHLTPSKLTSEKVTMAT